MNKYVFITGATSGFGEACAKLFAKEGWDIIITGRRKDRLNKLKTSLENDYSVNIIPLCFDVRDQKSVVENIKGLDAVVKEQILILINNAGLAVGKGPIDEGIIDDWDRMIDTNIKGLLYVSNAIIPLFKAKQKGHIINIGSIAGKEVYPGGNVYCASKHAVDALSKAMRIDLVNYNIKVTNIAPGAADTEFSLVRFKGDENTAKSVYQGFDPLTAIDIAETALFVANRPDHVNINDIVIMPAAQASPVVIHKKN